MHQDLITVAAPGELHEPAGIIRLRRVETLGEHDGKRWRVIVTHVVERITMLPRSGDFGALVERVADRDDNIISRRSRTVRLVDITAGKAILEPLRKAGLKPTPITVASSIGARATWGSVQVGEAELAGRVAIVLAEDRLRVDPALEGAQELAAQLGRYTSAKPQRVPTVQQPFTKPERQELVRALAIGLWWGDRQMSHRIEQPIPPPPEIDCSPPTFDQAVKRCARR